MTNPAQNRTVVATAKTLANLPLILIFYSLQPIPLLRGGI